MHIVDTHAHIYHADETLYPMKEDPFRPEPGIGTIEHLRQEAERAGVHRVTLVQTGSAYQWDNRVLGDTAAANPDWTVGVCTLDPAAPESVTELERLATGFNVKGLRMEPARGAEPAYYHPGSVRLWEAARRLGVVICAHVSLGVLDQLAMLLKEFPEVPVVLDHCAYPKVDQGIEDETVKGVVELAGYDHLRVKLTFAVTGSKQEYPFRDTHPLIRCFVAAFGPERCVWGSDFPCEHWLKKSTYVQHLNVFREELGLSRAEQEAILSETPMRLWFGG